MEPIRLIRNKVDLRGTCYFELLPGEYKGRCWNEESVFLSEEVFGFIEPIIARYEPRFDHYSFVDIDRANWMQIIAELELVAELAEQANDVAGLRNGVGFFLAQTDRQFAENFKANAEALAELARELIAWLRNQLHEHDCVSVLGI